MGLSEAVQPPARRARHEGHRLDPPRRPRRLAGGKPFELTREVIHVSVGRAQAARRRHRLRAPQAVPGEHDERPASGARRHEAQRRAQGPRPRPARQPGRAARAGGEGGRQVRGRAGPSSRPLASQRGARGEESRTTEATEPNYPIAVLVNGSSASASEIVDRRAQEPRPRRHHRRDDVRQGQRAARLPDMPERRRSSSRSPSTSPSPATSRSRASASRRTSSSTR